MVLYVGAVQRLVGMGVFAKNQFPRWAGVVVFGLNTVVQLL